MLHTWSWLARHGFGLACSSTAQPATAGSIRDMFQAALGQSICHVLTMARLVEPFQPFQSLFPISTNASQPLLFQGTPPGVWIPFLRILPRCRTSSFSPCSVNFSTVIPTIAHIPFRGRIIACLSCIDSLFPPPPLPPPAPRPRAASGGRGKVWRETAAKRPSRGLITSLREAGGKGRMRQSMHSADPHIHHIMVGTCAMPLGVPAYPSFTLARLGVTGQVQCSEAVPFPAPPPRSLCAHAS